MLLTEGKGASKSVVQPICRDDGTLDEELLSEKKKIYGKESLDVKTIIRSDIILWRRR